ncbi:hypothetical protein, partial [Sinorhizobium meliloti]|uniref:hypothetical protein n=1 Tax=Rhizobium meliloti TaxID=382 RepID=UPI001AECA11C
LWNQQLSAAGGVPARAATPLANKIIKIFALHEKSGIETVEFLLLAPRLWKMAKYRPNNDSIIVSRRFA